MKEDFILFKDGWYDLEYDSATGVNFIWNSHRSSLLINSDQVTTLEFTVKSGPVHPLNVTFTFLDTAQNILSSETRRIDEKETRIKIEIPRGTKQCILENNAFVPAMVTYGSVDIRALGLMFIKSVTVYEKSHSKELPLNKIRKFSEVNKKVSTKEDLVSVIFPVYGDFYVDRFLLAVASVRAQKDVNVEVVVTEQGTAPKLKGELDKSVKYLFCEWPAKKGFNDFNPGQIRNRAIAAASGKFIYTNDADVIFMNDHFLAKSKEILEQNHDMVLHRPPMRRLPLDNFDEFKKRAKQNGIQTAITSLDLSNEFLATTDGKKRDIKIAVSNSEGDLRVRTTSLEEFNRYVSDPALRANEHTIWSEVVHYGGNFLRKEQLENIGGYCEKYVNWGCEDTDLQWKLKNMFNLQLYPKIGEFTILHLDHDKRYLRPEMLKRNEDIFQIRRQRGIYSAIMEDKRNYYAHLRHNIKKTA